MRRLTAVPVLAVVAIAGCGSSSKSSSSNTQAAPTSSAPAVSTPTASQGAGKKSLAVVETEYKLTPATPSVAGGAVHVTARNAGTIVHALEIENAGPGGKDLRSTDIQPGSSTTVVANLTAGKTYTWYCPIDGHRALGMHGTITVRANGSASVSPAPSSTTTSPPAAGGSSGSGGAPSGGGY
jgi:uncharacterized cupredoxin-like copper-binding protein